MKKIFALSFIATAMLFAFTSCHEGGNDPFGPDKQEVLAINYYVLNNGNWGSNDASIGAIDLQAKKITPDVFKTANNKALGDVAQDAIVYGSKMYIAVYGSATVFAVNKSDMKIAKAISEKSAGGETLSPRHFTTNGAFVYVTYYEGYVGAIDTTTLSLKQLVKVGDNPEDIAYCSGKLYVANSGGMNYPDYGHTVSVIDAATMTVEKELEVNLNPNKFVINKKNDLYLLSWGDYAATPAQLQLINTANQSVSLVADVKDPYDMALGLDENLYVLTSSYDENWNAVTDVVIYNTNEKKYVGQFSSKVTDIKNKYSISTDYSLGSNAQGVIFIGTSDYISTGDIYIFDSIGSEYAHMDTGGLNPIKVVPASFAYYI